MSIELVNGDANVIIHTDGGVVERYSVDGRDVLFPRQELNGKMRGGSHVCAPYFGPGREPDQPQHGYGRTVEWTVKDQSADAVVLSHAQTDGDYAGLEMELRYALEDLGLAMTLTARNLGSRAMRLTPGFHPYFTSGEQTISLSVNGATYSDVELADTVYLALPGGVAEAGAGEERYKISSGTLKTFAFWSSHPEKFVCIEPTLAGNSFSEQQEGSAEEYLTPGDTRSYSCRVGLLY